MVDNDKFVKLRIKLLSLCIHLLRHYHVIWHDYNFDYFQAYYNTYYATYYYHLEMGLSPPIFVKLLKVVVSYSCYIHSIGFELKAEEPTAGKWVIPVNLLLI